MTKPILLRFNPDQTSVCAQEHATRLVNNEISSGQLIDALPWQGDIADVIDVLKNHIRETQHGPYVANLGCHVTTTLLQEPDAEAFRRGVEDGMKSSRVCGVMAGLVGFACGAFLAVLLLTIGGVA